MTDTNKSAAQIQNRADFLRSKIAKAQNELDALGVHEVAKLQPGGAATKPNVLIAIPTHDGKIEFKCVISLLMLHKNLKAAGVNHDYQFVAGLSQITFARNHFANRVLFDTDRDGLEYTHLLFIDSDNSGFEDYVVSMLKADKPIVALPYSFKSIHWNMVADAARKGVSAEYLPEFCGNPVWNAPGQIPIYELARVQSAGTGMMLIKREVFQALADSHPGWQYRAQSMHVNDTPKREFYFDFFQMGVDPKTLNYRPEDFFFCNAASELGFGTWVLPMARTLHTGSFDYVLNLPAGLELSRELARAHAPSAA